MNYTNPDLSAQGKPHCGDALGIFKNSYHELLLHKPLLSRSTRITHRVTVSHPVSLHPEGWHVFGIIDLALYKHRRCEMLLERITTNNLRSNYSAVQQEIVPWNGKYQTMIHILNKKRNRLPLHHPGPVK